MEKIDIINNIIKMYFINMAIYFTYIKISNNKNNDIYKTCFIIIVGMVLAILHNIFIKFLYPITSVILINLLYGTIIGKIIKEETNYSIIITIVSFIITYSIYLISVMLAGSALRILIPNIKPNGPIALITIIMVASLINLLVIKMKRFKNGFNFLKKQTINKNIIIYILIFCLIITTYFNILQKKNNRLLNKSLMAGIVTIAIVLTFWIKSQITKTYKNRMRDRTIEMQKTEIDEQARIMDELKAENLKLASAVHKYNKKFSSLEYAMENALKTGINTEFADELSVILDETKEASKNFAKEVETNINKLPLTNNVGIDNMFKYMQEEARKKDINFDLKLNTSINPLLENIISKDKFETIIGDHLKDAIIAVDKSSNSYKSILVTLGLVEGNYEFSVYDTGIEFEVDTLLKLGKEQVTTHKEDGGSGIGFMTTFETLNECKASLVIEEYNPETTNYTKAVIIRFDGKNEYKIYSYRAEKIKEQKHERRIIIEKLK